MVKALIYFRADSRFAPSQLETALLCEDASYWLGANLESALYLVHVKLLKTCYDFDYKNTLLLRGPFY